jgi:hypothetical protein
MTIRFRSEAASDVALAREWYDAQRSGLGDQFVEALDHLIDLISDLPGLPQPCAHLLPGII